VLTSQSKNITVLLTESWIHCIHCDILKEVVSQDSWSVNSLHALA